MNFTKKQEKILIELGLATLLDKLVESQKVVRPKTIKKKRQYKKKMMKYWKNRDK